MESKMIKECEVNYFKNISKSINIHQLINLIQYGANANDDGSDLIERQKVAKKRLVKSIKIRGRNTKRILEAFEKYGEMIQLVYFEIGVQIGICLQTELLLQRNVMQGKGKKKKRTTEFKEHLFHVLSEAHEPVFWTIVKIVDTF